MVALDELVWVEERCGDGTTVHLSTGGRFQIYWSFDHRAWVGYDWDAGKRSQPGCLAEVKEWCEQRVGDA